MGQVIIRNLDDEVIERLKASGLKLVTADIRLLDRVHGTPWETTVVHIKSAVTGF